jgi:hypothetical protein
VEKGMVTPVEDFTLPPTLFSELDQNSMLQAIESIFE